MTDFKNRFSWSISRENTFHQCRRYYFFHYYFSWGGWRKSTPRPVREAYKLKRLVSLPLWRGQLVHYIASKFLESLKKKGRVPEKEDVINYTLERFDTQLEFSRRKRYLTVPKKRGDRLNIDWLALRDHEYGREIDSSRLEDTRRECVNSIEGLYQSPLLEEILKTDSDGWDIEDLDHAEFSRSFTCRGVDIYARTDFTFPGVDGFFNIVDWKTFRNDNHAPDTAGRDRTAVQLGVYGYYASKMMRIEPGKIRLLKVNLLGNGKVREHLIENEDIKRFEEYIEKSIAELASVLVDGDIQRNQPRPIRYFPRIENGLCRYCNFYRLCKDPRSKISF